MYAIDHISIVVKDIKKSKEFYQKAFGCKFVSEMENERLKFVYLKARGQTIELLQYLQEDIPRERGVIDHIAFRVDNLEEAMARMKEINVKPLMDAPRITGNKKIIFYEGLDKERIEFVENL